MTFRRAFALAHLPATLGVLALLLTCCLASARGPDTTEGGISRLVGQSEFVGFIRATPMVSAPGGEWRQGAYSRALSPLKGRLERKTTDGKYFWIWADRARGSGYPTWFDGPGEHLVFLRRGIVESREVWTTLAAMRVDYRPGEEGRIAGTLGDRSSGPLMDVATARALLRQVVAGGRKGRAAVRRLAPLFQGFRSLRRTPVSHDERRREVRQIAAAIRPGTTRAEVQKVFPQEDGGLSGPNSTRYYVEPEVIVEVPYDQAGGAWKPQNRVNGPLKVYRSLMAVD